jgi:acyl-CoA synthetase (AMP-forming)/AMP-acid ligase II
MIAMILLRSPGPMVNNHAPEPNLDNGHGSLTSSTGKSRPFSANVVGYLLEGKEPDRVALRLHNDEHSYGALQRLVEQVATYLIDSGGQKGDRVILLSDNSLFWVATYLGVLRTGLVCVPLPAGASADELQYVLAITEPRFAFVQARLFSRHRSVFQNIDVVTDAEVSRLPNTAGHAPTNPVVGPDDLAALMFTSGSTGRPRGVMVSHGNIAANTESIIAYLGLNKNDRMMAVLPFHYCFGTSLLHTHLRVGASLVIGLNFMYPEMVLQEMATTECTGFAGVPSHFQILLRSSSLRKKRFPRLRHVQQAGGYLAPGYVRELQEALPGTKIFIMYGQTEATSRLSFLPPELLEERAGSIGRGIPGVRLRVLSESGAVIAPGEVGEIVAEGENVARGYWRAPIDSADVFRDGVLHTGDLATVDSDGFIYITGRAKDFIKCGGKRVSCRELEEQILKFDALLEAAVVGVPDVVLGEAVKAFVVSRAPDSCGLAERVLLFCKQHLSFQLVPREIVVLDALPKNASGKVLKEKLKAARK